MPPLQLDLTKSADKLKLDLTKRGITPPELEVGFDLDVSQSFHDEHEGGITNDLMSRFMPWAMTFDPDKKADVFTFSDGRDHAYHVGDITAATHDGYVKKRIIEKVPGYNGLTDYHHVLQLNLRHFGWIQGEAKRGFLGFGKKAAVAKRRSLIIFITDGDNKDKDETEQVLAESEARKDGVYFQFIGIANGGGTFPFLKKIGDRFNNTGLIVVPDLKDFVNKTDEELNEEFFGGKSELAQWLKTAA